MPLILFLVYWLDKGTLSPADTGLQAWSRALESLIVTYLDKKLTYFMERKVLLKCLKGFGCVRHSEPDASGSHFYILFFVTNPNITLKPTTESPK